MWCVVSVLWCIVVYCVVLCCVVMCCGVSCCVVLCCVMLCCHTRIHEQIQQLCHRGNPHRPSGVRDKHVGRITPKLSYKWYDGLRVGYVMEVKETILTIAMHVMNAKYANCTSSCRR